MLLMALTYDEDADLMRLAVLNEFGLLQPDAEIRFCQLRQRDRRAIVREPTDIVSTNPVRLRLHGKREWGD